MKRCGKIFFLTLIAGLMITATTIAASAADSSELKVLELVNKEREAYGLDPLIWSDDAYNAAKIRAGEVLKSFSHTRPNNTQFSTVFAEVGITYTYAGENIAYGYTSAESVVEAWMNSAGHRANILSTKTKYLGVAVVTGSGNSPAWVQEFFTGTPVPSAKPIETPAATAKPAATPIPTAKPAATPVPTAKPAATPVPTAKPAATPVPTAKPQQQPGCTVVVVPSGSSNPYETPRYQPPEWDTPSQQPPQDWVWFN